MPRKKQEYPNGIKKCTKCHNTKPLTEFYYHRTRKHYMASCRECNNKKSQKYQTESNYRKTETYVFYQRAYEITRSAKNRKGGLEVMDGLKEHLIELWTTQDKKCYYTGVEMSLTGSHNGDKNAFSVDRIDSSKGYIKGNIVLCTFIVNKMKQDLTLNELYNMCDLIQKNIKSLLVD